MDIGMGMGVPGVCARRILECTLLKSVVDTAAHV